MRATYLALRLFWAACAIASAIGCAQGYDDEATDVVSEPTDGGRTTGSKDARASANDTPPSSGGTKDAATAGSTGGGTRDASTGSGAEGSDEAASGTAIKCPSPMVCNSSLAAIISFVDTSIKSTDNLCSTSGGILPTAVSCTTVDTCKSSRLTTATCTAGSCVQPCTP